MGGSITGFFFQSNLSGLLVERPSSWTDFALKTSAAKGNRRPKQAGSGIVAPRSTQASGRIPPELLPGPAPRPGGPGIGVAPSSSVSAARAGREEFTGKRGRPRLHDVDLGLFPDRGLRLCCRRVLLLDAAGFPARAWPLFAAAPSVGLCRRPAWHPTFFSQAFALYHPERVRSVVLDAAYGVEGLDPWYPEIGEGIRFALRRACGRDAGCAAIGGDPVDRLAALVAELRLAPLVGLATDSRGRRQTITLDAPSLASLVSNATYEWQIYRELDPAVRAALDGDPLPILHLAGEQRAGFYGRRYYSQALENAASCADYPQLYAMTAEPALRRVQYRAAIDRLAASTPEMFSPFDLETWLVSPFNAYGVCLDWPAADAPIPPFPTPRTYPDVPVLVLNGDLDTITPVAGAELVAARFPGAIFVTVANAVHVTALGTIRDCSPLLVREFIATGAIADASCAAAAPAVRVPDAFWPALDAVPAAVGPPLDVAQRRLVTAALATLADVLNRRPALYASRGRGLRGGRYRFMAGPTTGVQMRGVELIAGVAVDGRLRWDEGTDVVSGTLTTQGMTFSLVWSPVLDRPTATVQLGTWSGEVAVP